MPPIYFILNQKDNLVKSFLPKLSFVVLEIRYNFLIFKWREDEGIEPPTAYYT